MSLDEKSDTTQEQSQEEQAQAIRGMRKGTTTTRKKKSAEEVQLIPEQNQVLESSVREEDTLEVGAETAPKEVEDEDYEIEAVENSKPSNTPSSSGSKVELGQLYGTSKITKKIASFVPTKDMVVVDDNDNQAMLYAHYINRNILPSESIGLTNTRGVSRIILAYSGFYIDIESYTNAELLKIHRESSSTTNVIEKIEIELRSIYQHMKSNSLNKKYTSYEEFISDIKLPDMWSLYWGMYNVNNPGINEYRTSCEDPDCGHNITIKKNNFDITHIATESLGDIGQDTINDIKNGMDRSLIKAHQIANTIIHIKYKNEDGEELDYLPNSISKPRIYMGMPNIYEALIYCRYMSQVLEEPDDVILNVISPTDLVKVNMSMTDNYNDRYIKNINRHKVNMNVRKMHVILPKEIKTPDGKPVVKVVYIDAQYDFIPDLLLDLHKKDYKAIFTKEVRSLIRKDGIIFKVDDYKCDNTKCNMEQKVAVILDIRDLLFTKAAREMEYLADM